MDWVTQAKSLKVFADKCLPSFCAVLSGRDLGVDPHLRNHYYPLCLASQFSLPCLREKLSGPEPGIAGHHRRR